MSAKEVEMTKKLKISLNGLTPTRGSKSHTSATATTLPRSERGRHSLLLCGDEGTQCSPRFAKVAFTLAEVLITLGIIGVVAAVTLPTLISNYKKSVVESKLKTMYALISNAVRMSEAKYGELAEWDRCKVAVSYECSLQILEKYIFPELKIDKICNQDNEEECWTPPSSLSGVKGTLPLNSESMPQIVTALLNNGMSLYMWAGAQLTTPHIQIWIDIDGPKKGKNMLGADVFGVQTNFIYTVRERPGSFMVPLSSKTIDEDTLRNTAQFGCSKDIIDKWAGYYCGGLIQFNNWKIPDDYPVKF